MGVDVDLQRIWVLLQDSTSLVGQVTSEPTARFGAHAAIRVWGDTAEILDNAF